MATAQIDEQRLEGFVQQALEELGATVNAALVVIGDQLGLYRAMAGAGALSAAELAERTGTSERYVREWLNAQAAGGYVSYEDGRYALPAEHPVGRVYYGASTLLCTPASLSQDVGLALGAQAGEARLREVVTAGGLTRFRRAAETPLNMVFEVRP